MDESNEQQTDPKRFLFAMLISGIILFGWQTYMAPKTESGASETPQEKVENSDPKKLVDTKVEEKKEEKKVVVEKHDEVQIRKFAKTQHVLVGNSIKLNLSSVDASVLTAEILEPEQYRDAGNLLEGLNEASKIKPYSLSFDNNNINLPTQTSWEFIEAESTKKDNAYSVVTYRFATHRFEIRKTFSASENPYVIDIKVEVTNKSDALIQDTPSLFLVGFDDPDKKKSWLDFRPDVMEGLCNSTEDMERALPSALEDKAKILDGDIKWGGVNRRYLAVLAIPKDGAKKCTLSVEEGGLLVSKITNQNLQIAPKTSATFSYQAFLGPKNYDRLKELNLDKAVDYGILTFICIPLRWLLIQCHNFTGNWGWAIILLTFLVRLALWPVNKKVYANSEGMKEIQPELAALKEKYKNDQKRLSEETMKLFRENGVSMLGCAPMLIQMPILLSFYWTILYSSELYHADFALWYTDLSAADPYYILPVLMGLTMFAQQQMMPTPAAPDGANANMMKVMMKIMPITMTAFMLFLPSGVNLYYFLSLLIGVIQQYLIKRSFANKREAKTT